MGLYLRKAFRAGPIRFNLSKSGIGLSGGVKGARLGLGPRGTYVHAGRHGLYYRKSLSSRGKGHGKGQHRSAAQSGNDGCGSLILAVILIGFAAWAFTWLLDNPLVIFGLIALTIVIPSARFAYRYMRNKMVVEYKTLLDSCFVTSESPPSSVVLVDIKQKRSALPKDPSTSERIGCIEKDVYQAVLDKVLDNNYISDEEAALIKAAESVLGISPADRLRIKKDIFSAAYAEAIANREITDDELNTLNNLIKGLGIPESEVQQELRIVNEIRETQGLRLPFGALPPNELDIPIQKSEEAYYQCPAKVLSKRKSKESPTGFEYTVRREGTLILTNKRVFVSGDGTTNIRFSDVGDVDVDIDEGVIEISKVGSGRPIILKADFPIYTGRAIDLLVNAEAGGESV